MSFVRFGLIFYLILCFPRINAPTSRRDVGAQCADVAPRRRRRDVAPRRRAATRGQCHTALAAFLNETHVLRFHFENTKNPYRLQLFIGIV